MEGYNMVYVKKVIPQDNFKLTIYYQNGKIRLFDMTKSWLWEEKEYQILHYPEEFKKVKPFFNTV